MNTESEIRTLLDHIVEATRARDIEALMRHYDRDVVAFDVINPLQYSGEAMLRRRGAAWFSSFDGPIHCELAQLKVTTGENVAVCHGLSHVVGTTTEGRELNMWWRTTYGLQKRADKWLVTHVHSSVPFDPNSGSASLSLEP